MVQLLEILIDEAVTRIFPTDFRGVTRELLQTLRKRAKGKLLSPERKKELERICLDLRERYSPSGTFDFRAAFPDHHVHYLEDETVFDPTTWCTKDGRYFMLIHPFGTQRYKDSIKAHEFGHIALNHRIDKNPNGEHTEQEADFFARELIDNYSIRWQAVQTTGLILHITTEHADQVKRYCENPKLYVAECIVSRLHI